MSKLGARILRKQRAESKAARALIRTLLDDVAREVPEAPAPSRPEPPPRLDPDLDLRDALIARDEIRELERWALFVALLAGGLVALGLIERC